MSAYLERIAVCAQMHPTYLSMLAVLGTLVVLSLLRGRHAMAHGVLSPLNLGIALLFSARISTMCPDIFGAGPVWSMVFIALNLAGFAFALVSIDRWVRAFAVDAAERAAAPLPLRAMAIGGAVMCAATFLMPQGRSGLDTAAMAAASFGVGATVPLLLVIFRRTFLAPRGLVKCFVLSASLLSASWMLSSAALMLPGNDTVLSIARVLDIALLVVVLKTIVANYVRIGDASMARAVVNEVAKDEARTEVEKLNKIAANLYEDSSDLIRKQKEQSLQLMRKVDHLENILEIGVSIQRRHDLADVLDMVVNLVGDNLGFKTVTLRLFNDKAQNFETLAYVGLSDEVRDSVVNYRIPLVEYKKITDARHRISNSYFIRNSSAWYGQELDNGPERTVVEDAWGEIDMLIVPLLSEDHDTIGYLQVENPQNPRFSVADVIESLESISSLAVVAIRNARMFKDLQAKNEKLRGYADKLSSLNKLKSNFVATISHEFRTPLTSIKAYCDTLLKSVDSVDRELLKQFLLVIDEESTRLMSLIEDILDFSQMESGATKFERTTSDLVEVAKRAAIDLEKNYKAKSITLHLDMPNEPIKMQVEGELIKQLFINLLHNASKFTRDHGNVTLRIINDPSTVRVTVTDDGVGVPEDQLGHIFDQFHQADSGDTRNFGGSGLGLAICKNIAEWHDGRIWVENIEDGGARFVVVLPKRHVVVKSHVFNASSTVRRFEIERLLELLVENVAELLQVKSASVMLVDESGEELRIESAIGIAEDIVADACVKRGEGIAGKVLEGGKAILVTNIEEDERFARSNNDPIYGSKSFMSVPIKANDQLIGVVNVANPLAGRVLTRNDCLLLEEVVDRVAVAIVGLREFADASSRYEQTRDTFKAILESRRYIDMRNDTVIDRVVTAAAERLGFKEPAIAQLRYALAIYDLGLSKVGYHIVKKPQELSPKDRENLESHTISGKEMLSVIETSPVVEEMVCSHHENFDGSGYPEGLAGSDIPKEARILRIADTLRALISGRPYQRTYSLDEAIDVIKHRSGTFFDPDIADIFVEVLGEMEGELATVELQGPTASDEKEDH